MPGSRLMLVLNPIINCISEQIIVPLSVLHDFYWIQPKVRDLKYKCNYLSANTLLGLLWIHLTLEINTNTLCSVTFWGQLTSSTTSTKDSHMSIFSFNVNYPESENHIEQKRHRRKYAILKLMEYYEN